MAEIDGDGNVSDGTHGPARLKNFALLAVCAKGGKWSAKRAFGRRKAGQGSWSPMSENPDLGHTASQRNQRKARG